MTTNQLKLFTALMLSLIIPSAYADITVQNNTNYYATAFLGFSPCSASLGDAGILKPHQTLTIPQSVINTFCVRGFDCEAKVYRSNNCSGPMVAKAKISPDTGVKSIANYDTKHIRIVGSGHRVTVYPA